MKSALLATLVAISAALVTPGAYAQPGAGPGSRDLPPPEEDVPASPMTNVLNFAPGSAGLGAATIAQLQTAAHWLRRHPQFRVAIEGHADASTCSDQARDLANRRASMVRAHLMGWGIASDRMLVLVSDDPGQHVLIFASDLPLHQLASLALDNRRAIAAAWTDRGTLIEQERGIVPPPPTVATRR
jgi:hypothetical protein